ncbi:MAG: lipo-like protein [Rhodospirillales bacterium]|nr:lipo-like protein [Rhodospirillales bacterium]
MITSLLHRVARRLAHHLNQPLKSYSPVALVAPDVLAAALRPGDVLLVDGNTRVSTAIKYLTQSTWSHAALFLGDGIDGSGGPMLIESDIEAGVRLVPLSTYANTHTRICRPVGLSEEDRDRLIDYAMTRLGNRYDLKNIVDLVRYLLPTPPVPTHWRRRMIALGGGEPTKAICSTFIAQAFQSIGYPILPEVERIPAPRPGCDTRVEEILHIRHYSLFAPRAFDSSPYFEIVKPSLTPSFNHRTIQWAPD